MKVLLFVDTSCHGFMQNAFVHCFFNSWFQTLQTTIYALDFYFRSLSEPRNPQKFEPKVESGAKLHDPNPFNFSIPFGSIV